MTNLKFQMLARQAVKQYAENVNNCAIYGCDVYIVWFCKTLQNYKAIISTATPDQRLYEVTYNGDKGEMYVDAYVKEKNICSKVE